MADNYLEKRMEEYRAGKLARKPRTVVANSRREPSPLEGFRVYVTGGASGIGRAVVEAFRRVGCRVAFCDIDRVKGAATAQATGSQFHPVDVTDAVALENSVKHVISAWGDIDIIINNVGVGNFKPFIDTTVDDFKTVLDTNSVPLLVTARTLAAYRMTLPEEARCGGRIVNISSTRHLMSEADSIAYSASKGAVLSMTHSLMMSLSPLGITVNCISPGWIHTGDGSELTPEDHQMHPSGRVGRPADIARACLFLAAPDADFINGADLIIDGGMTRKMIY